MDKKYTLASAEELRKASRLKGVSPLVIALVLSFAFLVYCAVSTGVLSPKKENGKTTPTSANTYTQLIPADYGAPHAVTVTEGAHAFTLTNAQGEYCIEGENVRLDKNAAKELLSTGASILARRKLEGAYAEYGIDDRSLRARFDYEGGTMLTLLLGQQVPTGEGWYAAVEGDPAVYIVNNALGRTLGMGKQALYELPDLAELYSAQTLASVTIERPGVDAITISRVTQTNPFNTMVELTAPIHYPANSERAAEVYLALDEIRLTGLAALEGSDADWGLSKPIAILTLRDHVETRLCIGATEEHCTLRINDERTVYTLDAESLTFLNSLSVPYLAEQLPGLVMLSQVAEIRVRMAEQELHFSTDQAAHSYTLDGLALSEEAFLPLYQQMIGLLIERYDPVADDSLPPRLQVEYTFRDGSQWTLTIAEYDTSYDLIIRDQCACFLISRAKTDALMQSLLAARDALQ